MLSPQPLCYLKAFIINFAISCRQILEKYILPFVISNGTRLNNMLPKKPGANKIDVKDHLKELVAFDTLVAKASPYIFPLETPEKFLDFFTKEHKSDMYTWNDERGNLVGLISVINNPDDTMEVLNIWVHPDFQRKGHGKKMMIFAENLAKEFSKERVTLVTHPKNLPAINFYKCIGYLILKKIDNYYGDGEPRYLLEKELSGK
jgi:ribosomal protein S18 acetylase RimI-like enzyme